MAARPIISELSLCAGVGWLSEGLRAGLDQLGFGHRTVCHVERDSYAAAVLVARMAESSLAPALIWDDLATFDGRPWRGRVDCVTAGLPCQPYSLAGKQRGLSDHRSYGDGDGPIPHALRIIGECAPALVFFENVPAWVTGGWFRPVGEELCRLGYTLADPLFLTAEAVGASHRRERVFVLAYRQSVGRREWFRQRLGSAAGAGRESGPEGCGEGVGVSHGARRPPSGTGVAGGTAAAGASGDVELAERSGGRQHQPRRGSDRRAAARGTGGQLAESIITRLEGRVGAVVEGQGDRGPDADPGGSGLPLFAPGPGLGGHSVVDDILALLERDPDAAWRRYEAERRNTERWIATPEWLWLATESGVRLLVNGRAVVLDESRADQLRCSGNGVVPLQGAVAFVELVRRSLN